MNWWATLATLRMEGMPLSNISILKCGEFRVSLLALARQWYSDTWIKFWRRLSLIMAYFNQLLSIFWASSSAKDSLIQSR